MCSGFVIVYTYPGEKHGDHIAVSGDTSQYYRDSDDCTKRDSTFLTIAKL